MKLTSSKRVADSCSDNQNPKAVPSIDSGQARALPKDPKSKMGGDLRYRFHIRPRWGCGSGAAAGKGRSDRFS